MSGRVGAVGPVTSVTSALVPQLLHDYGALTRRALQAYLPHGQPARHLYDLLRDYPARGGKMMRPSLCIASARAFGARTEKAVHCAVSIELLHNALLIHDDIEDESEERRGKPTLHRLHGVPLALNAGDTLTLFALQPLLANEAVVGPQLTLRILEGTERMALASAEGQAMELGWRRDNSTDLDEDDYLQMVLKKTCWLACIYPSWVGAIIGQGCNVDLDPFIRFGFFLGAAFQIQDDLLNLVADARYGKERDGDLWEGKRTLMVIRLFEVAAEHECERLAGILALDRTRRREQDIAWVRALMDQYNCIEYARAFAHGLAGAALHEYTQVYGALPESPDKRFIRELITWVFERT